MINFALNKTTEISRRGVVVFTGPCGERLSKPKLLGLFRRMLGDNFLQWPIAEGCLSPSQIEQSDSGVRCHLVPRTLYELAVLQTAKFPDNAQWYERAKCPIYPQPFLSYFPERGLPINYKQFMEVFYEMLIAINDCLFDHLNGFDGSSHHSKQAFMNASEGMIRQIPFIYGNASRIKRSSLEEGQLIELIQKAVSLECDAPPDTEILYRVNKYEDRLQIPAGILSPKRIRSLSYGLGLFAGSYEEHRSNGAVPWVRAIDVEAGCKALIVPKNLKMSKVFHIPSGHHPLLPFYQFGEWFHARTKVPIETSPFVPIIGIMEPYCFRDHHVSKNHLISSLSFPELEKEWTEVENSHITLKEKKSKTLIYCNAAIDFGKYFLKTGACLYHTL